MGSGQWAVEELPRARRSSGVPIATTQFRADVVQHPVEPKACRLPPPHCPLPTAHCPLSPRPMAQAREVRRDGRCKISPGAGPPPKFRVHRNVGGYFRGQDHESLQQCRRCIHRCGLFFEFSYNVLDFPKYFNAGLRRTTLLHGVVASTGDIQQHICRVAQAAASRTCGSTVVSISSSSPVLQLSAGCPRGCRCPPSRHTAGKAV